MKTKQVILGVMAVTAVGFGLLCPQTHANPIPITGTISINGEATLNDNAVISATEVLSIFNSDYVGGTGAYALSPSPLIPVAWGVPFGWGISSSVVPSGPLWSFWSAGVHYYFDMTTISETTDTANKIIIGGTGDAYITGSPTAYGETLGTWSLTIQSPAGNNSTGATFSFSSSGKASGQLVPDGGMTITLLGLSLAGICALRRKHSK